MKTLLRKFTVISCIFAVSQLAIAKDLTLEQEVEKMKIMVELHVLHVRDQGIRQVIKNSQNKQYTLNELFACPSYDAYFRETDKQNQAALKRIIAKTGWPSSATYGELAESAAWEVAQHAIDDHEFQVNVLHLMKNEHTSSNRIKKQIAYLEDRVLVHEGKPQIYGSQMRCTKDHHIELQPIKDPANVDKLRKSIGLPSMAEYQKNFIGMC